MAILPMNAPSNLVPVGAASQHVGLSVSTLNKLRVFGGGPVFLKLGRRVVYDLADLDAWLATKRRRSTSDAGQGLA
ncbi:DNA-binding protein [Phenylobacterium sp. 20VBR1]|uniref:DNA-binding protein n=1 Tax=Phenylobacterium glaciei TaxID=2803784 RepID=A0A941HVG0_9CAUL|nr:helix-turn-helix domain-containing protein [Phenylobacterium glaciei]MBR7618122.1 DNA-binding protein [Phenylobacterium glaciei]